MLNDNYIYDAVLAVKFQNDRFHETKLINVSSHPDSEKIKFNCDCNQDAMMPLTKASVNFSPVPIQEYIVLSESYNWFIPACQKSFCSLKGPPALSI